MTPRKHAELIKAWADGAEIQRMVVYDTNSGVQWETDYIPDWSDDEVYRIKPVPKADIVHYIGCDEIKTPNGKRLVFNAEEHKEGGSRWYFKFVRDGETGEAKKVEIVK